MNDHPTPWMSEFAKHHNLTLRFESPLPGGVPAFKYEEPDGAFVVLDASLPAERQHFALAHEAAHILLGHSGEVQEEEEFEANRLASELLLPESDFRQESWRTLSELKEFFPHASFEALARRRLAFVPGVLTVVDNGSVTRRFASEGFTAPHDPAAIEWELIRDCLERKEDLEALWEGVRAVATYVDSGEGIVRVLLFAEEA